jgi:hypothetical protein
VVFLIVILALMVPATAVAGPTVFVKIGIDTDTLKVRPHEIFMSADGTFAFPGIKYESWGGPVAKATSRAYTRGCDPFCADGKVLRPKATLRFSDLLECEGRMVYGRLSYVLHGRILKGFLRRSTEDMRPTDERGKPVC